jgi:hypothetical protein
LQIHDRSSYDGFTDDEDDFEYWHDNEDEKFSDNDECDNDDDTDLLASKIANWALNENITMKALTSLLQILHPYHPSLPRDPRTLLSTPKSVPVENLASGGVYYHFGIENCIKKLSQDGQTFSNLQNCDELSVQCNIDGLPLFKSTGLQMWPILGLFKKPYIKRPFVIGVFVHTSKPSNLNEFLQQFVDEGCRLEHSGVNVDGKIFKFRFHSFVCDAPARAMLKNTKSFSGYYGCDRCIQSGKYLGRMTYPDTTSTLRTDEQFKALLYEDHHLNEIPSPLAQLSTIGLVNDFVLDYMHLVCLGVTRKLLLHWIKGPLQTRLPSKSVADISEMMVKLRSYIPCEFARKPRSLHEIDRFKATEFRLFLLYIGPVVLKGNVSDAIYKHFLLLHVAISCLVSNKFHQKLNTYAKNLLVSFVQYAEQLYGGEFLVYNVHCLVHIADDVRRFGPLDNISSFPFENHLKSLKKLVRKPSLPLQQIVKRIAENDATCNPEKVSNDVSTTYICERLHENGPIIDTMCGAKQFSFIMVNSWKLSLCSPNNCVLLNEFLVGLVRNILQLGSQKYVVVNLFNHRASYFDYPVKSEKLNIYYAKHLRNNLSVFHVKEIISKCICIPIDDHHIIMPFL